MRKRKITISGMHCASCATNIERSLKKVAGVKEVSVSVMLKKGMIETSDDVTDDELTKAVARAGYTVTNIE